MDSLALMASASSRDASLDASRVLFLVWDDLILAELIALPAQDATPALREQLTREGTPLHSVWARSCLEAARLAFPQHYTAQGQLKPRSHSGTIPSSTETPDPSPEVLGTASHVPSGSGNRVKVLARSLVAVSRRLLH